MCVSIIILNFIGSAVFEQWSMLQLGREMTNFVPIGRLGQYANLPRLFPPNHAQIRMTVPIISFTSLVKPPTRRD